MEKIPRVDIAGARVDRIPPPVVNRLPAPVVESIPYPTLRIPKPVVEVPSVRIDYPTLPSAPLAAPNVGVPAQSGGERGGRKEKEREKEKEKPERKLPASTPPPITAPAVQVPQPPQPPQPPRTQAQPTPPTKASTIQIAGHDIQIPTPKEITQASATAVVGTSVTLATAMIFNQARRVIGEAASDVVRKKFKVKLRAIKPVIHMIDEGEGITVMEYSSEGIRTLATHVENPEQFLRDTIEADELYEADHKIVIDDNIRQMFSKEGAKRFNYFAPAKKLARRLSARLTLG